MDARQALMDAIRSGTGAARLRKVSVGRGDRTGGKADWAALLLEGTTEGWAKKELTQEKASSTYHLLPVWHYLS